MKLSSVVISRRRYTVPQAANETSVPAPGVDFTNNQAPSAQQEMPPPPMRKRSHIQMETNQQPTRKRSHVQMDTSQPPMRKRSHVQQEIHPMPTRKRSQMQANHPAAELQGKSAA